MANEKRLIDANKVLERANEVTFMGFRAEERKRHFMDLVSEILGCFTEDAVEVVRCKDCRFIIDREDGTHGCYLHFLEDCKPDDFCSYGERKDNDTN